MIADKLEEYTVKEKLEDSSFAADIKINDEPT